MNTELNAGDGMYLAAVAQVLGDDSLPPRVRLRVACNHYWRMLRFREEWTDGQRRLVEDIRPLLGEMEKGVSCIPEAHVHPLLSTLRIFASKFRYADVLPSQGVAT